MTDNVEADSIVDETNQLGALEAAIRLERDSSVKEARSILLWWLRQKIEDPAHEFSISELIVRSAKEQSPRSVAPVVLRSVAAGILSELPSNQELARAVTALCETGTPELYAYLKVDPKAQAYIRFQAVSNAHDVVCDLLSPLRAPFEDTDAALASRKEILGRLNHKIVRAYCDVFDLQSIKTLAEGVFYRLKLVAEAGTSLLLDVEACKQSVADGRLLVRENGSFLVRDFLSPMLDSVERTLEAFLHTSRSRFRTSIIPRFNGDLQKRYPLHEVGRELQISVPFVNSGPGLAVSVIVTTTVTGDSIVISNSKIHLGSILPGDFSVALDALVIEPMESAQVTMLLDWSEIGEPSPKTDIFEFGIGAQATNIDWSSKEYWHPYSSAPAEGSSFIGRQERVKTLAAKILRSPMESFYITGQKRVGKTSLALACIEFAKEHVNEGEIHDSYNLWGSFAFEDPRASLEALGRKIESLIRRSIPAMGGLQSCDFRGSLSSLTDLCNMALQIDPTKRFVVVIDEFDEIHQELYLFGNLAETFFANLRALSRCKNMCIVLVGGENMPYVMERQGQKLNNFSRVSLSYYARATESVDFKLMITAPTDGVVSWYDDAIGEVFNVTNGNPYFAKIVCSAALEVAISARDADISLEEIRSAIDSKISLLGANSFVHLWQDGIAKPMLEREPEILLRLRVLVAIARCFRHKLPATVSNIYESRVSPLLSEAETSAMLNDFVRREVLIEQNGIYIFLLPIFEKWLVDVGAAQLASDSLTAELASATIAEELEASVRADEIAELVKSWPAYRGRHVGSDEVRAWLQQVPSAKDQRLLFHLLKRLRVVNEGRVRELLELSFSFLQPLPEFVIRKKSDRRKNVIVSYVDGEGKSGYSYAAIFAEANMIASDCIFPPGEFAKRLGKHLASGEVVDAIVIVDDFVGTGKSLLSNVEKFMVSNANIMPAASAIRIISLAATAEGLKRVLAGLQKMDHANIDFRACELLSTEVFAFPEDKSGWRSVEDYDRAKSLCVDLGRRIYKQSPLGYGDRGLLLVFPTNAPNNSLPIIHSPSRAGSAAWKPLFMRVTH